jgi:hypothetical protein
MEGGQAGATSLRCHLMRFDAFSDVCGGVLAQTQLPDDKAIAAALSGQRDAVRQPDGRPGFFLPYFHSKPLVLDEAADYADPDARLTSARTCQWIRPLGAAGPRLDCLHVHEAIAWRMFACPGGEVRRAGPPAYKPWPPLAYSLEATRP